MMHSYDINRVDKDFITIGISGDIHDVLEALLMAYEDLLDEINLEEDTEEFTQEKIAEEEYEVEYVEEETYAEEEY